MQEQVPLFRNRRKDAIVRIVVPYVLFGGLWIIFSDRLNELLSPTPSELSFYSTFKGLAFILVTAILLSILVLTEERLMEKAYGELAEASEELRKSEKRLRFFLENTPAAIVIFDYEMKILTASRKFKLDYGLGEMEIIGHSFYDVFQQIPERWKEIHRHCLEGNVAKADKDFFIRPDGKTEWIRWEIYPWYESGEKIDGIILFSEVITDRVKAREAIRELNSTLEKKVEERTSQLEELNRELEAFSYSVSHDLRAPLRAMDGYVRMLLEDYGSQLDDEGKRICSVISKSAQDMGRLIDDLLSLSRAGRTDLHLSSVDMQSMARSLFFELTTPAERERIDFQVDALPPATGDPTLLRQIWYNLLSNAVKFSSRRDRAVITVTGEEQDGETVYTVRDNGAGFDMKYADKLFGVFQRLHSAREYEGTGVGLAIVKRIILRHGGRVWGESEVGKGAAFHFTIKKEVVYHEQRSLS